MRGLASFSAGVNRIEAKQVEEARQWLASPDIEATELSAYALYLLGKAQERSQPDLVRQTLARLSENHPDFTLIDEARLRFGRLLMKDGKKEGSGR